MIKKKEFLGACKGMVVTPFKDMLQPALPLLYSV